MLKEIATGLIGAGAPVASARRVAVSGVIIGTFAVTGYVALIGALWYTLSPLIGPAQAWLVIAGLSLLAALVTWGVAALIGARARAEAEAARAAAMQAALAEVALTTLPRLVRDHPFLMMLAAAGVAYSAMPKRDTPPEA